MNFPDPDDPQRMLLEAHRRLSLAPERHDGSKLATIATYGRYGIRLVALKAADATPTGRPHLWLELYDHLIERAVDSAGCWNLDEARTILQALIAETLWRNGMVAPDSSSD
jgi:hypothetical protein